MSALHAVSPFDFIDNSDFDDGLYLHLTNEQYHKAEAISKSGLDLIAGNPSTYQWQKDAPVDTEKLDALDVGTALHCAMLEPEEFSDRFIIMPDFNLRSNDGKASRDSFMVEVQAENKIVLASEVDRQLKLMRDSAYAHPMVRRLMAAPGQNEASIFWTDKETGQQCRVRPDRHITDSDLGPVIIDVKKCADISRLERHVEDYRYHVQHAMYCDGYKAHFGEEPTFLFLVIDSTISAGRYRVDVVELEDLWVNDGYDLYRRDLTTYAQCKQNNDWLHIRELKRPRWANK
ncbi:PD-(D/E)XK nuclease-like domain-containing protein [Rheinheimera sp. MMS21-TC3]|uniref:PD-(D/E)XK nuclease-like domain-containing protein n=1 Tax=Rheinheimera sp. MMS21-TC3 TaxID=3072790 RepID=UPI0028C4DE96|nr:PD-(D/E)XK nuclease-like domain-containing protein [Rheinheimera sp. MMS21-TC3]WNO60414.1 PD-(D/E)XK nuclease-like domain-containing protein [Rheinheimera sp. MMS21-TC3]